VGDGFEEWQNCVTYEEFEVISLEVLNRVFLTKSGYEISQQLPFLQDHIHENTLLYNCDVLYYLKFCQAIKAGDIG
jgi:hypothetical protein